MLGIFRNNQLETGVLVVFYAAIFFTNVWLQPHIDITIYQDTSNVLGLWIYELIGTSPMILNSVFFVLLLLQAFMLNSVVNNYRLAKRYTFITAICYVLMSNAFVTLDYCSPAFISNTFLILALQNLYPTFSKKVLLGQIFNVGFWVGIASLIYAASGVYILLATIGLLILRPFDLREMLVLLSGYIAPLFLMGVYQFVSDDFGAWWQHDIAQHYFTFEFLWSIDITFYISMGIVGIVGLWGFLNAPAIYFKTTTREKKYINIIYLMLIVGGVSLVGQNIIYLQHFSLLVAPLAVLLSLNIQSLKSNGTAEFFHLVLFMAVLSVQYLGILKMI
ncbi:MAG: hypothetical protein GY810_25550 [Aureispira sp.]|nr:hypothetical protein [Aureispira sp.]